MPSRRLRRRTGRGGDAAGIPEERILNVYNWDYYIGESTIADFEAKTGINVTYDTYDATEVLETKLLTGHSGYDIVVASHARVTRFIGAGALRKVDKSKLRNLPNMDPEIMRIATTSTRQ